MMFDFDIISKQESIDFLAKTIRELNKTEYEGEIKDGERIIIEIEFMLNNCVDCDSFDAHTPCTWVLE